MVDKIFNAKTRVLEYMDKVLNKYGADKMDVAEIEKLADVVKDLSEAEKLCMEADYYNAVTEAMESGSMGYDGMGNQNTRGSMGYRRGYRGQSRDSMGRYTRNYRYGHDDMMMEMRQMLENADPQEKERLKQQIRQLADM